MAIRPPTHGQLLRGPRPARDRDADRRYDEGRRDDLARRVRSSARWQEVRKLALARDRHLCVECLKLDRLRRAAVVDHIERLRDRPDLAYVLSNLQSLCTRCNARKNVEERRGT